MPWRRRTPWHGGSGGAGARACGGTGAPGMRGPTRAGSPPAHPRSRRRGSRWRRDGPHHEPAAVRELLDGASRRAHACSSGCRLTRGVSTAMSLNHNLASILRQLLRAASLQRCGGERSAARSFLLYRVCALACLEPGVKEPAITAAVLAQSLQQVETAE